MTHFDHERIPERIVHARGTGAHGYFELTESLADYTTAPILTEVGMRTPVFARFSTVAGGAGSGIAARSERKTAADGAGSHPSAAESGTREAGNVGNLISSTVCC